MNDRSKITDKYGKIFNMVHNPKNSQKILVWCLESVLNLVFKAVDHLGTKLSQSELGRYFSQNFGDDISNKQISQMVYDLKRNKYIHIDSSDSVRLTGKAKLRIIDKISETKDCDGKYRLISFDIPETKKRNRNNFRRAIKRIGFKQVQKSLWVSDRNVADLVDLAIEEYEVDDYVAYFMAERSNIDKYIKKVLAIKKDKPSS